MGRGTRDFAIIFRAASVLQELILLSFAQAEGFQSFVGFDK